MLPSNAQAAVHSPSVTAQQPLVSPASQPLSSLPPKPSVASLPRPRPQSRHTRAANRRSASWTPEEDAKLRLLVSRYISTPPSITASNTWSRVAQQLPCRTGKQCRERYLNQLRPGIRRDPWTYEEETILNQVHARLGNKWVAIAKHLPGRTDNCVKNHWNSMLRKRQRRQAALKQTETQVSHTLSRSNRPSPSRHSVLLPVDNSLSSYPHSTTPSEMSSHLTDFVSSGIPSPFTVLSPLTPPRDAKLQISSLLTARSSNDMLACNMLHPIRTSSSQSSLHMAPTNSDLPSSASTSPAPRYTALQLSTPINTAPLTPTHSSELQQSGVLLTTPPPKSNNSTQSLFAPVSCILSPNDSQEDLCNVSPIIETRRASTCPTPRLKQNLSQSGNHILIGVQRKTIQKSVSTPQVPANPLAALAAAASSIPLSPSRPKPHNCAISSSKADSASQEG